MSNEEFVRDDHVTREDHDPAEGAARDVQEPQGGGFDATPLPGVKAHDPEGTDDPELSDEELAERLRSDPTVDSKDGVVPDDDTAARETDTAGLGAIHLNPRRPT